MYKNLIKPILDFILAFLLIIIFSPIILIVALLIKLKLGSPILFTQERPGLNGKIFRIYKFRTMSDERDSKGDLLSDELRLKGFGKFIRKSSLDELPQLFNVLKGDISLVGPRALIPQELNKYEQKHKILNVKSGITGLAQISGRRDLPWEQRRKLDVYYVQNWSFALDIQILFKTVWQVFTSKGAV